MRSPESEHKKYEAKINAEIIVVINLYTRRRIDVVPSFLGSYTCHIIWKTDNKFPNCIPKEPFDKADKAQLTSDDISKHTTAEDKAQNRSHQNFKAARSGRALRASEVVVINNKLWYYQVAEEPTKRRVGFLTFGGWCKISLRNV